VCYCLVVGGNNAFDKSKNSMSRNKKSDKSDAASNAALPGVVPINPPAPSPLVPAADLERAHFDKVVALGGEVLVQMVKVGEKYYDLCLFCRQEKLAPKLVSTALKQVGFRKQRIAEINKVWQCADELWNQFEARTIGFRDTLEKARGAGLPPVVTRAIADSVGTSAGQVEDELSDGEPKGTRLDASTGEADAGGSSAEGAKPVKADGDIASEGRLGIAKRIGDILRLAEKVREAEKRMGLKTPYRGANNAIGNGWRLVLSREKKKKAGPGVAADDGKAEE